MKIAAAGDTKKHVSEVFRALEKKNGWHKCIISEGVYCEEDMIVIDK